MLASFGWSLGVNKTVLKSLSKTTETSGLNRLSLWWMSAMKPDCQCHSPQGRKLRLNDFIL